MVRAQMLSELEEIIAYKQYADQPERQATMRRTWMRRYDTTLLYFIVLMGCQATRVPTRRRGVAAGAASQDTRAQPRGRSRNVDKIREPLSKVGQDAISREDHQLLDVSRSCKLSSLAVSTRSTDYFGR